MPTPSELVYEYTQLDNYVDAETKRFGEHLKPHKQRMEAIKNKLLEMMNEQGTDFKTDYGTAYRSTITTPKVDDKEKFLDWVLDDWDHRGDFLQIGAPQIDAFRDYVDRRKMQLKEFEEQHGGPPEDISITPPGTSVSYFVRVNIRPK